MAHTLRSSLSARAVNISHSESLELVLRCLALRIGIRCLPKSRAVVKSCQCGRTRR
nr:hypothetical protein [Bradyrhizobium sp. 15]